MLMQGPRLRQYVPNLCPGTSLWLTETLQEYSVAAALQSYLLARGNITVGNCVYGTDANLMMVSLLSGRLGCDSFLEGRISSHWLAVVSPFLCCPSQFLLPLAWDRQFISRLHNIIHKQWIYQNSFILFKGKTHTLTDPDTLLPRHWFLFEVDSEALGSGPTSHGLLWLADMDNAIAVSCLARLGTLTPEASAHFSRGQVILLLLRKGSPPMERGVASPSVGPVLDRTVAVLIREMPG